jgi:hypothetical protein
MQVWKVWKVWDLESHLQLAFETGWNWVIGEEGWIFVKECVCARGCIRET